MKFFLATAIFLTCTAGSFAQKTKTLNVAAMGYFNITSEISYAADGVTPADTIYKMIGVDNQSTYDDYSRARHIPIATGSLQKMYDIMQSAKNMFATNDLGLNQTVYDVKMSFRRPVAVKEVWLYSSASGDLGYTKLKEGNIDEVISRIELYARKHQQVLKKWKENH